MLYNGMSHTVDGYFLQLSQAILNSLLGPSRYSSKHFTTHGLSPTLFIQEKDS